ncbi:MAG: tetratricopeptide repeat protein [Bacteroidales bacterium]
MNKLLCLFFLLPAMVSYSQTTDKYFDLGVSEIKSGNYEKSIEYFNAVIRYEPKNTEALMYRGFAKSQLKNYNEAISDFNSLIEIEPGRSSAYDNRGLCKKNKGDYTGALEDYSKAIELEPENANPYHNRAVVEYYFLQDTIGACYDWRSSANLGYQKAGNYFFENCYGRKDIKTKYKDTDVEIKRRNQYYAQRMTEDKFRNFVQSLNIEFTVPEGFKKIEVIPNCNMPYLFSLKHKIADFEIRFYIESYAKMQEEMKQMKAITDKNWFNKIFESSFTMALSNISQGVVPKISQFNPKDVNDEFNADAGLFSSLYPDSEYANNYGYCFLMMLHKDNVANIYVSFLGNDLEKFNDYLTSGFYVLKFKK